MKIADATTTSSHLWSLFSTIATAETTTTGTQPRQCSTAENYRAGRNMTELTSWWLKHQTDKHKKHQIRRVQHFSSTQPVGFVQSLIIPKSAACFKKMQLISEKRTEQQQLRSWSESTDCSETVCCWDESCRSSFGEISYFGFGKPKNNNNNNNTNLKDSIQELHVFEHHRHLKPTKLTITPPGKVQTLHDYFPNSNN